jgi:hypothetical protein
MGAATRSLVALLALVSTLGPARGAELDPAALTAARGPHRQCVERLVALQAVRNPLCVALIRRDPSMCLRVPVAAQPACRVLAGARRWMGILLRPLQMISRPGDPLDRRCPAALPPGTHVDEAPCRRLLLFHVILPGREGRADVLIKSVNPFDEAARCEVRLAATHHGYAAEARVLSEEIPPRSPLDRHIPIRYDAGTQVEVNVTCTWGP